MPCSLLVAYSMTCLSARSENDRALCRSYGAQAAAALNSDALLPVGGLQHDLLVSLTRELSAASNNTTKLRWLATLSEGFRLT